MNENASTLTQSDLVSLGLSKNLVKEICRDLSFTRMKNGVKLYNYSEIQNSIKSRLKKPGIKLQTKEKLEITLSLLSNQSKVIEVDFLRNLTTNERIEFWKNYREELREKGEVILKDVDKILKEAKSLL